MKTDKPCESVRTPHGLGLVYCSLSHGHDGDHKGTARDGSEHQWPRTWQDAEEEA